MLSNNWIIGIIDNTNDITMEEWLDIKYSDHNMVNKEVKEGVVATWLVRSYKKQFEEYMEIKKQWEVCMDWYTKNALWLYWKRGDDEMVLTDEELSNPEGENIKEDTEIAEIFRIETDIFHFKTPLREAFNKFNYLFKIDVN
ncbi:hypothetical protein Tco_0934968, partial [Tanacetum coccineum]